jgi:hypothetical protein
MTLSARAFFCASGLSIKHLDRFEDLLQTVRLEAMALEIEKPTSLQVEQTGNLFTIAALIEANRAVLMLPIAEPVSLMNGDSA